MREELESIRGDALRELAGIRDETALEDFRVRFLGRKGRLTAAASRSPRKRNRPSGNFSTRCAMP
jgi:phenylalanyl-tRNA synthetase alpha chain